MDTHRKNICLMVIVFFAAACVIEKEGWDAKEEEDAGDLSPAPVYERKPLMVKPKAQGASCTPKQGKLSAHGCAKGLFCVPASKDANSGTCLLECGQKIGKVLQKDETRCPPSLRCLRKKTAGFLTLGMFCMEPQNERNGRCHAPLDEYACALGLTCLPIKSGVNACKEECSAEKACRNAQEPCLIPPYARLELQYDKNNKKVWCDAELCEKSPHLCTCDANRGFFCRRELRGPAGRCTRKWGVCGEI